MDVAANFSSFLSHEALLQACSFCWIIVAESTVRWFIMREKHCWMTANLAEPVKRTGCLQVYNSFLNKSQFYQQPLVSFKKKPYHYSGIRGIGYTVRAPPRDGLFLSMSQILEVLGRNRPPTTFVSGEPK
jgi:hypothetical protein